MSLRLIVTGATGTAGSDVVREALNNSRIERVTVLTRRWPEGGLPGLKKEDVDGGRLKIIQHSDFLSYPPDLISSLKGHTACIWALGITSAGQSLENYTKITHAYPLAAAKAFSEIDTSREGSNDDSAKNFVFCYLSGDGANQEGSRMMFPRVKGLAEKELAELPSTSTKFSHLVPVSFRPGYIAPNPSFTPTATLLDPSVSSKIKSSSEPSFSFSSRLIHGALTTILPGSKMIPASELANGMLEVCLNGGNAGNDKGGLGGAKGNSSALTNNEIKKLAANLKGD